MKTEKAIIVFVKNSEAGKVKTRIAKTTGNEKALSIYLELLKLTREITLSVDAEKFIFYDSYIPEMDLWEKQIFQKEIQSSGDLGMRMFKAFNSIFDYGFENIVIIGSDCPELSAKTIDEAFKILKSKDIVIGPSVDGGYYLLGMNSKSKKYHNSFFINKKWSTETVLRDTLLDIKNHNLTYSLLDTLNDIDTEKDWEDYIFKNKIFPSLDQNISL